MKMNDLLAQAAPVGLRAVRLGGTVLQRSRRWGIRFGGAFLVAVICCALMIIGLPLSWLGWSLPLHLGGVFLLLDAFYVVALLFHGNRPEGGSTAGTVLNVESRHQQWAAQIVQNWAMVSTSCGLGRPVERLVTVGSSYVPNPRQKVEKSLAALRLSGVASVPVGIVLHIAVPVGMTAGAVEKAGDGIRHAFGAASFEVIANGSNVRLILGDGADLFAGIRPASESSDGLRVTVGRASDGSNVVIDLSDASHIAIQGMTRSGKSAFCYGLLSQVGKRDDVQVVGIDPNQVLLGPWVASGRVPASSIALGDDVEHAAEVLESCLVEMRTRLDHLLSAGLDKINPSTEHPCYVIVLEEYPGLLLAAAAFDAGAKPADRITPRIKSAVSALTMQSAKVAMRVVLIVQRADASIIGGAERGQFGTRITFAVDNAEAVEMLNPGSRDRAPEVKEFPPGRALVWQHRKEIVMQADYLDYQSYRARLRLSASDSLPYSGHVH